MAGSLRAEVKGKDVALLGKVLINHLEYASGIDDQRAADLVERLDLIHAAHAYDNLVKDRYRAAYKASITALRNNSKLLVVAEGEDLADLLGRAWLENKPALASVLPHPVLVEGLDIVSGISRDAVNDGRVALEDFSKVGDMLGSKLCKSGKPLDVRVCLAGELSRFGSGRSWLMGC
jgi:hypothetical protein